MATEKKTTKKTKTVKKAAGGKATAAKKTKTGAKKAVGLVIVESPAKARTLKRYLGAKYDVKASVGHVKDLPAKKLGVDVANDFMPEYTVIRGKGKVLKELKSAASKVREIYLAPDPDREGEAIAWHIAEELKNKRKKQTFHRVLFHELTKKAIKEAMSNPGELDQNKFESQQARRILDRLVGYEISPLLWDKVRRGLSAGRVQSVAVRLICDREKEIRAFVPEEYWSVHAWLKADTPPLVKANVVSFKGKKLEIKDKEQADSIVSYLNQADFVVSNVEVKERRRRPLPPFITSTMQQEAARRLRFSARKTMTIAQHLYEGVDLGAEGPTGLITYMRTDSTRSASEAVNEARSFIKDNFEPAYLPSRPHAYKKGTHAQDAHEAIRPTSVMRTPESVASFLDADALALYTLIWKRFVASQMAPAVFEQTKIDIKAGDYILRATGTVEKFPGFLVLYQDIKAPNEKSKGQSSDTASNGNTASSDEDLGVLLPPLKKGDELGLDHVDARQHFTQPPPRYSEASLIKALEEKGIGRPSTYATILSTIRNKDYVRLDKGRFVPTELGMLVTELLISHFPEVMGVGFTAEMERELDLVEEGKVSWVDLLKRFYSPFNKSLEKAKEEMKSVKVDGVPTDLKCPKCGAPLVIKYGRSGEFLACSAYPDCKHTSDFKRDESGKIIPIESEEKFVGVCDKCGRPMVVKKGRFGEFLACTGYPECKNTRPITTGVPCPVEGCTGELVKRRSRTGKTFYSCSRYPECKYAVWDRPIASECPLCGWKILVESVTKKDGVVVKCPVKGCNYRKILENEEN